MACELGAICYEDMDSSGRGVGTASDGRSSRDIVTHLVAARGGSQKVKLARSCPTPIHIVHPTWLNHAGAHFSRGDEAYFKLPRGNSKLPKSHLHHSRTICTPTSILDRLSAAPLPPLKSNNVGEVPTGSAFQMSKEQERKEERRNRREARKKKSLKDKNKKKKRLAQAIDLEALAADITSLADI